ncbi:MAG TPA: porin [Polyangia bacterium]|jgi:hypothetical protein|nr:porin [Polyangia bacterium]
MRARAGVVAICASLLAAPARAADPEPWPPSTAPGFDDSAPVSGAAPAASSRVPPAAPARQVVPIPREVPPPPSPAEASEEPPVDVEAVAPPNEAATAVSAPDAALVAVGARGPRRNDVELGSRDGQFFLRTPGDEVTLLPSARLEIDGSSLRTPDPYKTGETLSVDRFRVDLAGWVGSKVYFDLSADVAYAFSMRYADNYVAVAPWGDRAIVQVGQFDAPFTLENRTPDRYLDFFDRSAAVHAFAIPENKDQGIMVHGMSPARNIYYSAAILNGEGPAVAGVSGQVDVMARGWVAPFSVRGPKILRDVTVGASAWTGDRSGQAFEAQATQGGYTFLTPIVFWNTAARMDPLALRQQSRLEAGALELNAPIAHRFGVRAEWIAKRQPLAAFENPNAGQASNVGSMTLSGWAGYAEIWGWALGSDRLLGAVAAPGLELPVRYADLADARARGGVMISARVDHIEETLSEDANATNAGIGVGSAGQTKLTAYTLGGSYWFTRRARLSVNYVLNRFDGVTPWLNGLGGKQEQEVLGRLALAL